MGGGLFDIFWEEVISTSRRCYFMHDYIVLHSAKRQESNMKDRWQFVMKSGVLKGEQGRAGGNEVIMKLHRCSRVAFTLTTSNMRVVYIEM